MITDVTGTVLIPGNQGRDCPGNGQSFDAECCCDECDYMQCCLPAHSGDACRACGDPNCPHSNIAP